MSLVIYVEDEEEPSAIFHKTTKEFFTRTGYTVHEFSHGEQAMKAIEEQDEIALLITDLALADTVGGLQVARKAVKHGIKRIIICSTCAIEADTVRFMDHVISKAPEAKWVGVKKPYQPTELLSKIEEFLEDC